MINTPRFMTAKVIQLCFLILALRYYSRRELFQLKEVERLFSQLLLNLETLNPQTP